MAGRSDTLMPKTKKPHPLMGKKIPGKAGTRNKQPKVESETMNRSAKALKWLEQRDA